MLVILDRDGVINEDSEHFIKSIDEWHPIAGSIDAIARLSRRGCVVTVATNQSGLGRGLFTLDDLEAMHHRLCAMVETAGGHIAGIFYCPHTPDDHCECRKPKTGLIDAIERELNISAHGAWAVGDSIRDLEAFAKKGCVPILVRTGKGKLTIEKIASDPNSPWRNVPVYDDLAAAATALLKNMEA